MRRATRRNTGIPTPSGGSQTQHTPIPAAVRCRPDADGIVTWVPADDSPGHSATTMVTAVERSVRIPQAGDVVIDGDLVVPELAGGVVVFAHGTGSGRRSPRNRAVATELRRAGLATLLLDLLTEEEEQIDLHTRRLRFDIELLARRLAVAAGWLRSSPELTDLPIGYFGASTGAAAALIAAADQPQGIAAVVSRGGRPDLARDRLDRVRCPTLLIVGGADRTVLDLNRQALAHLKTEASLEIVPGATHLFEEPGALDTVAQLAQRWFSRHLTGPADAPMSSR
jgi:putative phosphoribosyl transferase